MTNRASSNLPDDRRQPPSAPSIFDISSHLPKAPAGCRPHPYKGVKHSPKLWKSSTHQLYVLSLPPGPTPCHHFPTACVKHEHLLNRSGLLCCPQSPGDQDFLDLGCGEPDALFRELTLEGYERFVVRCHPRCPILARSSIFSPSCRRRGVFDTIIVGGAVEGANEIDIVT